MHRCVFLVLQHHQRAQQSDEQACRPGTHTCSAALQRPRQLCPLSFWPLQRCVCALGTKVALPQHTLRVWAGMGAASPSHALLEPEHADMLQAAAGYFRPKQARACVHALRFTVAKQRELARQRYVLAHQLQVGLDLSLAICLSTCFCDCTPAAQHLCTQALSQDSEGGCDALPEVSAVTAQLQENAEASRCAWASAC